MKVKALDESHLLLILSAQEADSLGLNLPALHRNTLASRLTIARLFSAACVRTGFDCDPSACMRDILQKVPSIGVRAMMTLDGQWILLFSTHPAAHRVPLVRRVYRVKTPPGPYCYRMPSCGDALNVIERLFRQKIQSGCQFFCWDHQYFLILHPTCRNLVEVKTLLLEYGSLWGKGRFAAAFLREHGKLLASNAIRQVGPSLIGADS